MKYENDEKLQNSHSNFKIRLKKTNILKTNILKTNILKYEYFKKQTGEAF
ncbi:hypothetical protein [Methanolapillus ohkumae]|uniref:Uncharacterized protein n=1 Tax=Methanolapillus ohkumae TaxID=3028298 RepID=A0AA96V7G6_9EURY|nr:hypothetical protein MsAm2_10420 [Methanosarcinaceae archaeon Am2]